MKQLTNRDRCESTSSVLASDTYTRNEIHANSAATVLSRAKFGYSIPTGGKNNAIVHWHTCTHTHAHTCTLMHNTHTHSCTTHIHSYTCTYTHMYTHMPVLCKAVQLADRRNGTLQLIQDRWMSCCAWQYKERDEIDFKCHSYMY